MCVAGRATAVELTVRWAWDHRRWLSPRVDGLVSQRLLLAVWHGVDEHSVEDALVSVTGGVTRRDDFGRGVRLSGGVAPRCVVDCTLGEGREPLVQLVIRLVPLARVTDEGVVDLDEGCEVGGWQAGDVEYGHSRVPAGPEMIPPRLAVYVSSHWGKFSGNRSPEHERQDVECCTTYGNDLFTASRQSVPHYRIYFAGASNIIDSEVTGVLENVHSGVYSYLVLYSF